MRRKYCGLSRNHLSRPPPMSLTNSGGFVLDSVSTMGSTQNQQQLPISSGGRMISFYDTTELQVRAIIWLARRETEERLNSPSLVQPVSSLSSLQSPLHSPPGISMKRSLQCFLQKRKNRIKGERDLNVVER